MIRVKLILIVMALCATGVDAKVWSQTERITVKTGDVSMIEMFDILRKQTNLRFVYSYDDVAPYTVSVDATGKTLSEILNIMFEGKSLKYEITPNHVVVSQKEQAPIQQAAPRVTVTGIVKDPTGQPLAGVTTMVKGTKTGTITDINGKFTLSFVMSAESTLVFSMLGMEPVEVAVGSRREFNVTMRESTAQVDEVVVTGLFERRKESFTGSATTFTQAELKLYGNQNIIASLKYLDPAFIVDESIEFGSDPNRLPEMRIRGNSSLKGDFEGDPNQPLFILDGFPATATEIFDLDMNRVASVTILKDAAAKAIYGSKASNGVVVVETIMPKAGELRLTYTGDLNIEAPDLTSYDLVNAREKLQVEVNAGRYSSNNPSTYQYLRQQYNEILKEIERGVDTYWLSKPLRTGVGQKHSLHLEGGEGSMRYGVDFAYNNIAGVMKGSNRETTSGAVNLSYRYNNLTFRNVLSVAFNRANDSPYGNFGEYSRLNSYWTPYDENGNLKQFLGTYSPLPGRTPERYSNPLYNATIGTKNFSKYNKITENFYAEWQVMPGFKAIGRFGFTNEENTREDFYPGSHSRFYDWTGDRLYRRGTYSITDGEARRINADITANYTKQMGKHMLLANAAWSISSEESRSHGMSAEGFINNRVDDITFAKQYALNGKPSGSESVLRDVGITLAANYSYDDRYLSDVSIRTNASSAFGANNRWGTFWSLGLGWNLHKEKFLKDSEFINQLKIRGSVGTSGNQNFSSFQAMRTYKLFNDKVYDNIGGTYLMGMANSNLKWQQARDINGGVELKMWNRLSIRFDTYLSTTDNLLVDYTIPTSTGFKTYKENLGKVENGGFDMTMSYQVYRNPEKDAFISLNGSVSHNVNRIKKISDKLQNFNDEEVESIGGTYTNPISQYREGLSMSAIWAVRSLGIDPANGLELFMKKNGTTTYQWSTDDLIVVGDTNPKFRGNFGISSQFKGLGIAFAFSYKVGGDYYNQSLITRVENVDVAYNVDRRVLEETWVNPGDIVAYKRIGTTATSTRFTSRFVEKDNELKLTSVNISYDFKNLNLKHVERLKCSFYMNDVITISTVKAERGLNYPFARTFSFSVTATF